MKVLKRQKHVNYLTLLSILCFALFFMGCSMAGISNSSTSGGNSTTSNLTMKGNFQITVDPNNGSNTSTTQQSIIVNQYTVQSLDITVAKNDTQAIIGTYHWVPTSGATSYTIPISGYGEYEIVVYQIATSNGNNVTSTSRAAVNVEPLIVTNVTIIPGASLSVKTGNQLQAITSNSTGTFVAVGDAGRIISSTDSITWSQRNSGTSNNFVNIRWSSRKSLFIAYGEKGTIATSPDGITWTVRNSNTPNKLYNVTENNSMIVLVGDNGTIITSTDGINWIPQNSNSTSNLNGGLWNTTALYFLVSGDNGTILKSIDGINWTSIAAPTVYKIGAVYSNNSNVLVKTIDSFGNYEFYTSASLDLSNPSWSSGFIFSNSASSLSSLNYSNTLSVSVCGNGLIHTSSDNGATWTLQNSGTTNQLKKVSYISSSIGYLAIGNSGTIIKSSDGINWSLQTSNSQNDLTSFTYSSLIYAVIGANDTILTSTDGVSWTLRTIQ